MAKFESLQKVSDKNAVQSQSGAYFSSLFIPGTKLTITGIDYMLSKFSDGTTSEREKAYFLTSLGHLCVTKMIIDPIDANGVAVKHDGTFNVDALKVCRENPTATNGELEAKLAPLYINKTFVVRRIPYIGLNYDGEKRLMRTVELDYA